MLVEITYQNGFKQTKRLVAHRSDHTSSKTFTMNSPLYQAIEDGTFAVKLLTGSYKFKVREI
jgi:hypothetical protein